MAEPRSDTRPADSFEVRFLRTISVAIGTLAVVLFVVYFIVDRSLLVQSALGGALVVAIATFGLVRVRQLTLASNVLLGGCSLLLGVVLLVRADPNLAAGIVISFMIVGLSCVMLPRLYASVVTLFHMAVIVGAVYRVWTVHHLPGNLMISAGTTAVLMMGMMGATLILFVGRYHHNLTLQQRILDQVRETVGRLAAATSEIAAMSRQQEQGAVSQAGAVTEIRQTLESLLQASSDIADSSRDVLGNAESTLSNNELIAERIGLLTGHARRISELLEIIKDIANKSELLALNASLEGAKAGEAGRGFSLVAAQMQRLAENVMESVKDVKSLVADVQGAMDGAVVATEEGTKLAGNTTETARKISLITQQQSSSTEQVTAAMEDISQVATQVASGSTQTLNASRDLTDLADQLERLIRDIDGGRAADESHVVATTRDCAPAGE